MFSCEYWEISKNTYFEEYLQTTASDSTPLIPANKLESSSKIQPNVANIAFGYLAFNSDIYVMPQTKV